MSPVAVARSSLTALRYVMYLQFWRWRHVFTQWPYDKSCAFLRSQTTLIPTRFCSTINISIVGCALVAKSVSTIALCCTCDVLCCIQDAKGGRISPPQMCIIPKPSKPHPTGVVTFLFPTSIVLTHLHSSGQCVQRCRWRISRCVVSFFVFSPLIPFLCMSWRSLQRGGRVH